MIEAGQANAANTMRERATLAQAGKVLEVWGLPLRAPHQWVAIQSGETRMEKRRRLSPES
jgi:hypothetical protein